MRGTPGSRGARRRPPAGRPASSHRGPDRGKLLRAARLFVEAIEENGLRRDLAKTPARVADAWSREILSGYATDPARILSRTIRSPETGMVVVSDLPFVSVCVHHLLPFVGTVQVGYLPAGRLVGLSKIARVVDAHSRRLQLQERLTRQVVDDLHGALRPLGVACRIEAEHLCMTIRGARKRGSRVVTSAYSGAFLRRPALRLEFLRQCAAGSPRGRRPGTGTL